MSNITRKLSVDTKDQLENETCDEELGNAVQNMKKNKIPGPDRIISEFYQIYWPLIGPIFKQIINNNKMKKMN